MPENKEKSVEKVVTGSVKTKKKSEGKKFVESFVEEDARNIGSYVKDEILIPTFKDLLSSIITNSVEMLLYGESARPARGSSNSGRRHVAYDRMYGRDSRNSSRYEPSSSRRRANPSNSRYHIDTEIAFDKRSDADAVLDTLCDHLEEYDQVSVGDYYSACDITPSWTDFNYGWESLAGARVERSGGDWIIVFPRPIALNN